MTSWRGDDCGQGEDAGCRGLGRREGGDRRSTGDPRAEKVLALRDTAVGFTRRRYLSKPADRPTAGVNPDVS